MTKVRKNVSSNFDLLENSAFCEVLIERSRNERFQFSLEKNNALVVSTTLNHHTFKNLIFELLFCGV